MSLLYTFLSIKNAAMHIDTFYKLSCRRGNVCFKATVLRLRILAPRKVKKNNIKRGRKQAAAAACSPIQKRVRVKVQKLEKDGAAAATSILQDDQGKRKKSLLFYL